MPAPSSPPSGRTRLVPLGGLGEVGMNCFAVEQGDDIIVVDCGIRFPWDQLGADVVRPDFTWLEERAEHVRGVFLTHGHEDHIGGLPYLLRSVETTVFGPPHALGLVRARLSEHDHDFSASELRETFPKKEYSLGSFVVEPIRVSHSIVEATALRIETSAGTIVHTGDFNFDPEPPDGEPTDEARLMEIADDGVGLLLSDSTNIDVHGPGGSERKVGESLRRIVESAEGRVFVALFASNIQRLIVLGAIAEASGRKVCALGRSLDTQITVASEIGRLKWPSHLRIRPDEARSLPKNRVLVLAGGTQGEPASSMARLAADQHPELSIEPGDTVVFSSRAIPGNDRPVMDMIGNVLRRGANVVTRMSDPSVHTSGHATRDEQARMLDLVQPRSFLPVHGTLHHLTRHAALARERGVSKVLVVENGASVLFDGASLSVEGRVPAGAVSIGPHSVLLDDATLRERSDLARYGTASVAIALGKKRKLSSPPTLVARGVAGIADGSGLRPIEREIVRLVESARKERKGTESVREDVRRLVKKRLFEIGGTRPVVDVHVLETDD